MHSLFPGVTNSIPAARKVAMHREGFLKGKNLEKTLSICANKPRLSALPRVGSQAASKLPPNVRLRRLQQPEDSSIITKQMVKAVHFWMRITGNLSSQGLESVRLLVGTKMDA